MNPARLFSRSVGVLVFASALTIGHQAHGQVDESRSVTRLSEETPQWLIDAAKGDDFKEPPNSPLVDSKPYADSALQRRASNTPIYHQPAGALTGKTLFAMAGHGWTYDSDEMYYYTQRGLSQGIVEDLGNADQMHIFAHMAFNAGATVIPFRPIDHQPEERVMDNAMPQVELYGDWRKGTSNRFFGPVDTAVPYVVSSASLEESAVARFRPYIAKAGYYPVYVWARDGADRSNQLYRIVYSGGTAEIRVNWRRAGKAWAWLGTYYFDAGSDGYVETTNQVIDPYEAYNNHVVVADAVRFGNGQGDVPRPGGISGFSREDEGDSYWIERSLGANADRRLFDIGRDGSSTVSSPPKAAAASNREQEGSFLDRVLISFHSNASSGKARGAVGLFNERIGQRPTYQESLAEIIGNEVNQQLHSEEAPTADKWPERERNTYSGINFGELRRDYLQNEMCATIVETAFHDNPADASYLLNPLSRMQMAQATFRGLLRWYAEVAYPNSAFELPPARPIAIAALRTNDGRINLKWKPGAIGEYDGGEPVRLRVYRSPNGYGFDGGLSFEAKPGEPVTVDALTTVGATFIRVTLSNSAGESFPSQTVAIGLSAGTASRKIADVLLIPITTVLDSSANVPYYLGSQPGGPYGENAYTERVRPVYAMSEPAGAAEALALAAEGIGFDGADSMAVDDGFVAVDSYKRVFVASETQNPKSSLLSAKLMAGLRSLLNKDGKLCFTGCSLAANCLSKGGKEKTFINEVAGVTGQTTAPGQMKVSSADDRFMYTTATFQLARNPRSWAEDETIQPSIFEGRRGRSLPLLTYGSNQGTAALLTRPFYSEGEVITLGFPLSLVQDPGARNLLMRNILKQM